ELERVIELPLRMPLEQPGQPIEFAYFIETGVASVVLSNVAGKPIEVGLIGREGLVGTPLALGDRTAAFATYMQVAGSGFRVEADRFANALTTTPTLRDLVLRFSRAFSIQ